MSTVYWIRRDFRLDDNPALFYALQQNCQHAVFITAYDTWREHNHSGIQVDFIERHLNWFSDQLTKLGIKVSFNECDTYDQLISQLSELCLENSITSVVANSEPELREKIRDNKIAQQVNFTLYDADTILRYGSVLNKQNEMFNVLDAKPSIKEISSASNLNIKKGSIKFEEVSFSYANTKEQAIKNINFSVEGGTTVALVGHSGAGKSTVVILLPRF